MSGSVIGLFTTPEASMKLSPQNALRAIPGRGLEGDRYYLDTGTKSKKRRPDLQATLIQREALDAVEREHGIRLQPDESRRNILTQGIDLNALVGCEFTVGEVRMRGIKLCEPCNHLEGLTQRGVCEAFVGRGGLRAEILSEGTIRIGDSIAVHEHTKSAACA